MTTVTIREDVIKTIATASVEAGITLIGGVAGVGKTTTAHTVINYIKDNNLLPPDHILYIDTLAAVHTQDDIVEIASSFLAELPDDSQALIVLDELYYEDSVELALMLAQSGKCVLGITQAYPSFPSPVGREAPMSSILLYAIMRGQEEFKAIRTHALLNHLNLLVIQDSLTPTHHRILKLDSATKDAIHDTVITETVSLAGYADMQIAVSQESIDTIHSAIDALTIDRH